MSKRTARERPAGLADFDRPPVNEVFLSIQFASLSGLQSGHIGLLWNTLRKEYPTIIEQGPLNPVFETFGPTSGMQPPSVQIQMLLAPPMSRFWFQEASGEELVQIQQDRIIHNWRSQDVANRYPRYESIRARFVSEVDRLMAFLRTEKLGELKPNQCEVSYTNIIEFPDGSNPHHHLERITPLWAGRYSEPLPLEFENAAAQARYILRNGDKPYGRIYVNFSPAQRLTDQKPVVRLEILARGKPDDGSIDAAFRLLDVEREAIVRTFAAVTTPEMHKIWGRTDVRK